MSPGHFRRGRVGRLPLSGGRAAEQRQLQAQTEELSADKENVLAQVQALRADNAHVQAKQQQIDKEVSSELPRNKGLLQLYHTLS